MDIPQEVKDKIEKNKPDVGLLAFKSAWELMFDGKMTISRRDDYRNGYYTGWHVGAEYGYGLAMPEIEKLKAEIATWGKDVLTFCLDKDKKIKDLKAENERLKQQLIEVSKF